MLSKRSQQGRKEFKSGCLKDLLKDPWKRFRKHVVEGEYLVRITNIEEFGVFVNLENGVDVLLAMPKNDYTRNLLSVGAMLL